MSCFLFVIPGYQGKDLSELSLWSVAFFFLHVFVLSMIKLGSVLLVNPPYFADYLHPVALLRLPEEQQERVR